MADTLQESGDALETVKTENETAAGAQVLREWEQDLKHIFILTSSGKPIFSKHGDEQYLSTTFGLIQAVVSIVENAGDRISCIIAGNRRIVYFLRSYLYFVSISSTEEPEAVLSAQLEFLYKHIIFVLTSKVHDVLRLNPSKDIRDLLGYDTLKQMYQSCCSDITPSYIAFNALNGFVCAEDLRHKINCAMMDCIEQSGAVMGVILYRDQLLSYCTNFAIDLQLSTSDLNLLASFVGKSNSLRSNDQNWVPICLPDFNPRAYLQAYVCNLKLDGASTSKQIDVSLVLISTSADPAMFNALHNGRQTLEKALIASDIPERLIIALESQKAYLSLYAMPISCLNFLFIFRPSPPLLSEVAFKGRQTRNKETVKQNKISAPVQCHSFALEDDASSSNDLDKLVKDATSLYCYSESLQLLPTLKPSLIVGSPQSFTSAYPKFML